jgi:uncharacterized phage protein gp47/JayE
MGGTLATATYYYRVTAYNEFGETRGSTEVSAAVTGPTGSVALDWADVAGADGYRVYRSATSGGTGYRIYSGVTSAFTDTGIANGVVGPPALNSTSGVTLAAEAAEIGETGNLAALAITNLDTVNSGIDAVRNDDAMASGTDTETDADLRERILFEFEGQGAGNQNDYRSWATAYPGVSEATVIPAWDGPNTVLVVVMGEDGGAVSGAVVDGLQAELDPTPGLGGGKAPIGAVVTVATPTVIDITVAATITFEDGYSLDGGGGLIATRTEIEDSLRDYIDNLVVGDDVIYDHVKAQFYRVPGVFYVASVTVNGGTSDVTIDSDPAEVASFLSATLS